MLSQRIQLVTILRVSLSVLFGSELCVFFVSFRFVCELIFFVLPLN